MNWRQDVSDKAHTGNSQRFEANPSDAVIMGRKDAVSWDNLVADAVTLPDLKQTGQDLIEQYLGYLPSDSVILPFEPFLRALIKAYWSNQLNKDEYIHQVEEHLKLIRNADMQYNTCLTYDEEIYTNYYKTFVPYGHAVKSRLTGFLGYEPKLEHSLIAEMWMRDVMATDTVQLSIMITPVDWKAITLIKYREVLLDEGKAAADASLFLQLNPE